MTRPLRAAVTGALARLAQALAEVLRRYELHKFDRRDRRSTVNGRNR